MSFYTNYRLIELILLAQKLVSEMLLKRHENNGLIHKLITENISDDMIIRIVADFIIAAGDTVRRQFYN